MPRVDLLSTNFSAGELSPRLYGRSDLQKYADAVKKARDVVLMQHGGVTRRPGTDHCGETKDSGIARLIPFVYSKTDAYVVEMGDGVYGAEAAAQYHFATSAANLSSLQAAELATSLPNPIKRVASRPGAAQAVLASQLQYRMRVTAADTRCVQR